LTKEKQRAKAGEAFTEKLPRDSFLDTEPDWQKIKRRVPGPHRLLSGHPYTGNVGEVGNEF
jgi:hypothetical protein